MKINKIFLTGTHHSGKSTLINKYKDNSKIQVMGELIRALSTQANFSFTPEDPEKYAFSELALTSFYYGMAQGFQLLPSFDKLWLFDRCIIDPLYYIKYFKVTPELKKGNLYTYSMNKVTELILEGYFDDTLVLLLKPIEITTHDGFRLGGEAQTGVFLQAREILNTLGVNYKEVTSFEASRIIENELNGR